MKHQGSEMGQFNQNAKMQNEVNPRESNRTLRLLSSTSPRNGSDQRFPHILSGPNLCPYPESANIIPTNICPRGPIGVPLLRTNISAISLPGSVQRFLGNNCYRNHQNISLGLSRPQNHSGSSSSALNDISTNDHNVGVLPRESIESLLRTDIPPSRSFLGSVQRFPGHLGLIPYRNENMSLGSSSLHLNVGAQNDNGSSFSTINSSGGIERGVMVEEGEDGKTRLMNALKRKSPDCDVTILGESSSMGAEAGILSKRRASTSSSSTQNSDDSNNPSSENFGTRLVNSINENQRISVARSALNPAGSGNSPRFFTSSTPDEMRLRLRHEVRSALEHLRNGGSLGSEDSMMLHSSIALTLLEAQNDTDEEDEEDEGDDSEADELEMVGLTEYEIMSNIGLHSFQSFTDDGTQEIEACCICQEDYVDTEELGRLDCGHRFHLACIKQWLQLNNTCPICKKMALAILFSEDEEEEDKFDIN